MLMRRRRSVFGAWMVAAVSLPVLLLASCGVSDTGGDGATGGATPGIVLTGTTVDGEAFDVASYAGRPVVVNFWASWCGYCREEMPDLVAFAVAHPDVAVIGVAVNDSEADAARMILDYGITFPTVWDSDGELFSRVESQGLPTTVFLTADLHVAHKIVGAADRAGFEAGLRRAQ